MQSPSELNLSHSLSYCPLQAQPAVNSLSKEDAAKLTERIQNAGTEVVEAKVRSHLKCPATMY